MKTKILIVFAFVFTFSVEAQVKRLNDPSIVAQHKRMVFESWGDFRPYPKYLFGIQTNFAYATVWGWLSPRRNQNYKNGPDIRPLKPTGEEVQRLALLEQERSEAENIKLQVDSLYTRNVQDFAHWTSATVDVDPLWLLYYKTMLSPLNRFPSQPSDYKQWGFDKPEIFDVLSSNGGIQKLQEKLDLLKDSYSNSRTHEMPRGKRFLMYHETLIGWREFLKLKNLYSRQVSSYFSTRSKMNPAQPHAFSRGSDLEIVQKIMHYYHKKF